RVDDPHYNTMSTPDRCVTWVMAWKVESHAAFRCASIEVAVEGIDDARQFRLQERQKIGQRPARIPIDAKKLKAPGQFLRRHGPHFCTLNELCRPQTFSILPASRSQAVMRFDPGRPVALDAALGDEGDEMRQHRAAGGAGEARIEAEIDRGD